MQQSGRCRRCLAGWQLQVCLCAVCVSCCQGNGLNEVGRACDIYIYIWGKERYMKGFGGKHEGMRPLARTRHSGGIL